MVVLATDGQLSVWDTSSFHYNVREMCAQRRHLARLQSRNKGAAVGEQSSGANAAHNPSAATDHGAGLSLPSMRHRPRGGATPLIYADAGDAHVCRTPPRMPHLAASARGKPLPSPTTRTTVDLHRSGPASDSASPVSLPHQVGYQASLHVSCAHGSAASCWAVDTHAGLAATAGEDGMLRLWDLESGAALASACVVGSGVLVAWVWRHMPAVRLVQTRGQPRDARCHATVRAQRVLRTRQTGVGGGCFVGRRGCILPTDTHHRQCWSWTKGNPASIGPVQRHTWQRASAWSRYVAACRIVQLVATPSPVLSAVLGERCAGGTPKSVFQVMLRSLGDTGLEKCLVSRMQACVLAWRACVCGPPAHQGWLQAWCDARSTCRCRVQDRARLRHRSASHGTEA